MNQPTLKPRKLARSVAKASMKKSGVRKINRFFRYDWRETVERRLDAMKTEELLKKRSDSIV